VYLVNDGTHGVPAAENLSHLDSEYYARMWPGKSPEWIKVFMLAEFSSYVDGKPVYPEYKDSVHTAKEELAPYGGLPLFISLTLDSIQVA